MGEGCIGDLGVASREISANRKFVVRANCGRRSQWGRGTRKADQLSNRVLDASCGINDLLPNASPNEQASLTFDEDDFASESAQDRRDLLEKMTAAGREHEYGFANDSQNRFARAFAQQGLKTAPTNLYNNLLADIEQRFHSLIYHPLICVGADNATVSAAIQAQIVDPLSEKYADKSATSKTIMNALYFLTERCHVRWDKPCRCYLAPVTIAISGILISAYGQHRR